LLSGNGHCSGDFEAALADAEAAIAVLDGGMQCDEKYMIKAQFRRVRNAPASPALLFAISSTIDGLNLQVAAMLGLKRDKDIAGAVRAGMAAFSCPEAAQRLRSALVSETSPLYAAWLAQVCRSHHCHASLLLKFILKNCPHNACRMAKRCTGTTIMSVTGRPLRVCNAALGLSN
jgi:hypothetical protein